MWQRIVALLALWWLSWSRRVALDRPGGGSRPQLGICGSFCPNCPPPNLSRQINEMANEQIKGFRSLQFAVQNIEICQTNMFDKPKIGHAQQIIWSTNVYGNFICRTETILFDETLNMLDKSHFIEQIYNLQIYKLTNWQIANADLLCRTNI